MFKSITDVELGSLMMKGTTKQKQGEDIKIIRQKLWADALSASLLGHHDYDMAIGIADTALKDFDARFNNQGRE